MYLKYIVLVVFLLVVQSKADKDEIPRRIKRNGHGYKDSVSKTGKGRGSDFDSSRSIKEMMDKVDRIDIKLDKLENSMIETSKVLNYWTETAGLEDHSFWKETTGCGGVIEATSGRITGNSDVVDADTHAYTHAECMWTILAGYRSKVKMTLKRQTPSSALTGSDQMLTCKVLEVTLNYGNSSDIPTYTMTSITDDKTYLFRGPLIYLSCYCSKNPKAMWVEFEGVGPKVFTQVDFVNVHPQNLTGFYDVVTELSNSESQLSDKDVSVITISVPGQYHDSAAPLKNILLKSLSPQFCDSSSLTLQFDAAHPNITKMIDCCKVDCLNHKFLIFNGYCIITISVNISSVYEQTSSLTSPNFAKLAWGSQEHSKLDSNLERECGGVVSGRTSGKISQTYSRYRANSRCVWVIHPFPKTAITVTVDQLSIEDDHDKLFAVELNDEGEIVNTTRFIEDVDTYNFTGRIILIVFYSDASLQLTGFTLSWEVVDDNKSSTDVEMFAEDDKIMRYTGKNGTEKWNITMPPSWPGLNLGVINHYASFQPYSYDISMAYGIFGSAKILLYGSTNGTFNLLGHATKNDSQPTDTFGTFNYTSHDGIFLILGKIYQPKSSLSLDFQWNQGKAVAPTSYSECGGVIPSSQSSRIDFKTGKSFGANARCIWFIECRYSTVTFHLIKNGITNNGRISITTIDTETGKISNAAQKIETTSKDVVVSGPLIMVTFTSSQSTSTETGFELEYKGSGESMEDNGKNYQMQQLTTRSAAVDYPVENTVPTSNDVYVFALNNGVSSALKSEKFSVQFMSHDMSTNNGIGQGYNFNLYSLVSAWNTNNSFEHVVECTIVTGELEDECHFLKNFTYSDFHSKSETFSMMFSQTGFVSIIKPLETVVGMASREFELAWNSAGCGGLLGSLPNGKVEYKLSELYLKGEDCIWLLDGTKYGATSISFSLESSGVLDRDYLYVYPVANGIMGTGKRLRYDTSYSSYVTATRNVTVPSGVAFIVFRSTTLYYATSGRGFRLGYTLRKARRKASAIPEGKTIVMSPNPLVNSEIELPFKKKMTSLNHNDTVILFFNSQTSSTSISSAYSSQTRLNITLQDVNLFANNKTCTSDTLYFYYYSYASFSLKDSYRTYKNPESNCSEIITENILHEDETPEDDYEDDLIYEEITSAPVPRPVKIVKNTCNPKCYENNVLKSLTQATRQLQISVPFVVIYKSNSNDEPGKKVKFSWNRNQTASVTDDDDD